MNLRRHLLASATACGLLLGSSSPGRCDIGPGDLSSAVSDLADKLLDSLCSWLLQPTDLPELTVAPPLPEPQLGNWPDAVPTSPDAGNAAAEDLISDQRSRADAAEAAVQAATTSATATTQQLEALGVLNQAAPVSVAAAAMVGNQVAIQGASAAAGTAQMVATGVAMQIAETQERAQAREAEIAATRAFSNNYDGQPVRGEVENIRLFARQR